MPKSNAAIKTIIDDLIIEGRKPTVRLIRERAGNKYSFTTISNVLKTQRANRDYRSLQRSLTQLLQLTKSSLLPDGEIETKVFEAANMLSREGSKPTNRNVRELIGKYSFKDISPALKKWKASQSQSENRNFQDENTISRIAKKVVSEFNNQGLIEYSTQNTSFDELLDEAISGNFKIPNDRREQLLNALDAEDNEAFFLDRYSLRNAIPDWISKKYNLPPMTIVELIEDLDIYASFFDQLKNYK